MSDWGTLFRHRLLVLTPNLVVSSSTIMLVLSALMFFTRNSNPNSNCSQEIVIQVFEKLPIGCCLFKVDFFDVSFIWIFDGFKKKEFPAMRIPSAMACK